MRISSNQIWNALTDRLHDASRSLAEAQERVITGRRVNKPSDDPSGTARIIGLRAEVQSLSRYRANAEEAQGRLDTAADALTNMSELLSEAGSLAQWGATGTTSQSDRESIARDLDALLEQALSLANTRLGRTYLFAGTSDVGAPYGRDDTTGRIVFRGNGEETRVPIAPGLTVAGDVTGLQAFGGGDRDETRFDGDTGARPGAGTDSGTGHAELLLRHTSTAVGDGLGAGGTDAASGVGAGTSSATADTILGSHRLSLVVAADGSGGTVALDGGTAITFTAASATDLRVVSDGGDAVHLDLTGVTAGFSGDVTLVGHGTLSMDGGATETAIDFSGAQPVVDSRTGLVTHVDTRDVERTGVEGVDYEGTFNVFDALEALRDELQNTEERSTIEQSEAITRRAVAIQEAHDAVLLAIGTVGARSSRMAVSVSQLDDIGFQLERVRSDIEDIDIAEAAVELTKQENVYQAALAVGSRLSRPTLLDYL